jgi:hypothetical protein
MYRFLWLIGLLIVSGVIQAQDTPETDDFYIVYYEDERPNHLNNVIWFRNVCLEAFMLLNPDVVLNDIQYGDQLRLPHIYPPCTYQEERGDGYYNQLRLKYYEAGEWLETPYYTDVMFTSLQSLEEIEQQYNICLDDLLPENILLQHFEDLPQYTNGSIPVFLPSDAPPCYPEQPKTAVKISDISPLYFVENHQICIEELRSQHYYLGYFYNNTFHRSDQEVDFILPDDALPCYNEQGQRLIYYDEMGNILETPFYSDLPIYLVSRQETLSQVAEKTGVCLMDLLRINYFPHTPIDAVFEVFIPPARPCPDDVKAVQVNARFRDLGSIATDLNICPEVLLALNPQFQPTSTFWTLGNRLFGDTGIAQEIWVIVPSDETPCYRMYSATKDQPIYEIELETNVCYEDYIFPRYYINYLRMISQDVVISMRLDAQPCYNEQGFRREYVKQQSEQRRLMPEELPYIEDMQIHHSTHGETVYSISQQYNVCVHDLLRTNNNLTYTRPATFPVYIPNTRPCYDEETGLPLIYEDANGNPLDPPQVDDQLIYYGSQTLGYMSYYYNVCLNRILEANQAKARYYEHESYLGWIIPTDRPPCYDERGAQIHYVCYDQPIDFTRSYRRENPPRRPNIDGAYCYPINDPDTVIWYDNAPYQIIHYRDKLSQSRAFTAWCYGVSLEAIDAINAEPAILEILPLYHRAIPQATRDCYLDDPQILDGQILHTVENQQTLYEIGATYNMPHQWIAYVNDIGAQGNIWRGQQLIIPSIGTWNQIYFIGGIVLGVVITSLLGGVMIWRRNKQR